MNSSELQLPSNKKFGYFFTLIFAIATFYFFIKNIHSLSYFFAVTMVILFFITFIKADMLLPFNQLWMRFGVLLSMIVSPLVLGLIFFGLFTPIAFLMRLIKRDELRLKFNNKTSNWKLRNQSIHGGSFRKQF